MPAIISDSSGNYSVMGQDGTLEPLSAHVDRRISEIAAKKASVGLEAKALFTALLEEFRAKSPRSTVDEAAFHRRTIVDELHEAVIDGRVDGELIQLLRAYSDGTAFGSEVRDHASILRGLLADEIAKVYAPFAPGPLRLAFELERRGGKATAHLTGTVEKDGDLTVIRNPRAEVDGRAVLLSDEALNELVSRRGQTTDFENSSQTKVFSTGLFGWFTPKAVHFDGRVFRMLAREDVDGKKLPDGSRMGAGWRYYHDASVAVSG